MIVGFNVATTSLRTAFASWKFVAIGDIECKGVRRLQMLLINILIQL
jgi:hypothetical protein